MSALKQKLLFDKKNSKKNHKHKLIPVEAHNNMDGQIILNVDSIGTSSAPAWAVDYLLLDDILLEKTGWKKHKDNLIADGIITQVDIDNEKLEPGASARIQVLMDKINNE